MCSSDVRDLRSTRPAPTQISGRHITSGGGTLLGITRFLTCLAVWLAYAGTVRAQGSDEGAVRSVAAPSPPTDTKPSDVHRATDNLQEVIVTARKVTERLQDVPISITAISAETLENSGAITLADIGREVPGLSVVAVGPSQNQLILRGLSSTGGASMVGYYIDDTPVSNTGATEFATNSMDAALFDLNRVEVLRGPQGTLYGASSMGGTVRYITNQPDLTAFHATAKATLSGTEDGGLNYEVDGLVNAPLASGVAAVRAVAFYRDYDGYIDRYPTDPYNYLAVLPGPVDRNVNTEKTYGARVSLDYKPLEDLTITPSVFYQRTNLGGFFTFDDPPGSFDNPIQSRLVDEPYTDEAALYSLTIAGDVHDVHITSSTSYFHRTVDLIEDESKVLYLEPPTPVPNSYVYPSPFENYFANSNFTEELRATWSMGRVHALVGLFYIRSESLNTSNQPILPGFNEAFDTPFGNAPGFETLFASESHTLDAQKAIFGELNYEIVNGLVATVGARYFKQSLDTYEWTTGVYNGGYSALPTQGSSASGTTPKYGLSYRVTPDILAYGTVAKGFREGGVVGPLPSICDGDLANLGLKTAPTQFTPDLLWSYELGLKTQWLDHRLTVNADIYYVDWFNVQQLISLPTCGAAFPGNFGTAASKGAELELRYEPSPSFRFALGSAFNQAQLTSTVVGAQGEVGDTLQNAPKWSGAASVEYHKSFGAQTSGFARLDFNTTSHEYNNFEPQSIYYTSAGYSLANLRFGAIRSAWQSSLFVTNLFNKRAETALPLSYAIDLPTTRRVSLNRPRTIGLDVRYDY